MAVQRQRMIGDFKTVLFRDPLLAFFDLGIKELFNLAATQAHQMIVMRAFIQFKHGLAGFKVVALQQAGLFELRQDAVNRCQANIEIVIQQHFVDIFSTQVPHFGILKNIKDFQARQRGFEAAGF